MKTRRRLLVSLLAVGVGLVAIGCEEELILNPTLGFTAYDDFSGTGISTTNWNQGEVNVMGVGGALSMTTITEDMVADSSVTESVSAIGLGGDTTEIQADVMVTTTTIPVGGQTRTMVELNYQPDAYQGISSQDFFGARMEIRDDGSGIYNVRKYVYGCSNADCSTSYTIAGGAILGSVSLNTTYKLHITRAGDLFTFELLDASNAQIGIGTVDMSSPTQSAEVATAFSGTTYFRTLLRTRVIAGTTGGDGGELTATWDNVMINGLAYDDFTAVAIDTTKWVQGEFSRTLSSGAVDFSQTQSNQSVNNQLNFSDPLSINGIMADVKVNSHSVTGTSPLYRARLFGYFYNDGTLTTGAKAGSAISDIFAEINMTDTEVAYLVTRCVADSCGSGNTPLTNDGSGWPNIPIGSVTLGSTHSLLIKWDGVLFTFQLDGETPVTFDPVAAGAPVAQATPNEIFKGVGIRANVGASGNGSGALSATIDNVLTHP